MFKKFFLKKEVIKRVITNWEGLDNYRVYVSNEKANLKGEIALLEARKENLQFQLAEFQNKLNVKDNEIKRLHDICLKLSEAPKFVVQK